MITSRCVLVMSGAFLLSSSSPLASSFRGGSGHRRWTMMAEPVDRSTPSQAGPKRARVVFLVTGLEFAMATQTVPARPKSG